MNLDQLREALDDVASEEPVFSDPRPVMARGQRRRRTARIAVAVTAATGLTAGALTVAALARPSHRPAPHAVAVGSLRPLFTRTTAEGIVLEAQEGTVQYKAHCPTGGICDMEHAGLQVRYHGQGGTVEFSRPDLANHAALAAVVHAGTTQDGLWYTILHVNPLVAKMQVDLGRGRLDQMAPADGYVVFLGRHELPHALKAFAVTGTLLVACEVPIPNASCTMPPNSNLP